MVPVPNVTDEGADVDALVVDDLRVFGRDTCVSLSVDKLLNCL